jgi:metal-responsive CopG/Arc/MetJ family transcriptional regulator
MQGTTRVTVSLPTVLVETIDRKLVKDQSRSGFVRQLLEDALRDALEQEEAEAYVRSYREMPQTEDEHNWPDDLTAEALAGVPWD